MPKNGKGQRIEAGRVLRERRLVTISGEPVDVPGKEPFVRLQFRRFAGCPVCNLHLQSVVRRHEEIVSAGIREVVLFHSRVEDLLVHAADLPFAVVADPGKRLYTEFGVESGRRALLNPRAWGTIARAIANSLPAVIRKQRPAPALNPDGGRYGLPADFLIARDGRVIASKYGDHAYDQWSVDELLELAGSGRRSSSAAQ